MTYRLTFSRSASSYLRRLNGSSQQRIAGVLMLVCEDPFARATKPLRNAAGRRAVRVGDLRVVFLVDEAQSTIHVDLIGPRGDVYRNL